MAFQELFDRLGCIDREAASLLEDAGYDSEEGLSGSVHALGDALEDAFLREQAEDLLEPFEILHEELRYLMRPVHGVYTLEQFPNGRYGYYDEDGKEHCFTCGDGFEAKICNKYGRGGPGTGYGWSMTGLVTSCAALAMSHYADSKSGRGGDRHDDGPETADRPFPLQRDRPSRNRGQ